MPAQFVGRFDRDAATIALELVRQRVIEQIRWQLELADQLQLSQLLLHIGKAQAPSLRSPPPPSPAISAPPPCVAERLVVKPVSCSITFITPL